MIDERALDWTDLRYFAAIAQEGSVAQAARTLRVSHSSVLRRLNALEAQLQTQLVYRHRGGSPLTADGEAVAHIAAQMQQAASHLPHRQTDGAVRGLLRVSTLEAATPMLIPLLIRLRVAHPALQFELIAAEGLLDLQAGAADVALRVVITAPPPDLLGVRLGQVAFAMYGHVSEESPTLSDPSAATAQGRWVVMGGDQTPQRALEQALIAPARQWFKAHTSAALAQALRQGGGRGILACVTADPDPCLVRLTPVLPELTLPLWMLYPRSLRHVPRLQCFREAITAAMAAAQPLLAGELADTHAAAALLQRVF